MIFPETPIEELRDTATAADIVAKINEVIRAINGMWNPADGSEV
jgi:hypothetical protein